MQLFEEIVSIGLKTGPIGVTRFVNGVEAVSTVGLEWLQAQMRNYLPANSSKVVDLGPLTSGNASTDDISSPPVILRKLFERLGATYVKLGQFIASSPSLFPKEYVVEFQKCLDSTPAVPFPVVERIIQEELGGRSLSTVFSYIDPTPIASASIAQVHGAKLRMPGGAPDRDVVVKVLKPRVEDTLTADLNFLYIAAKVLEFLNPELGRTSLANIVSDIRSSMMEEVDFRKEASNINAFRDFLRTANITQATAPEVFPSASSVRLLTMERLYGVPLTDLDAIREVSGNDPEGTLITALNTWFASLVACDTFHADVHAGNLLVLRDGRIGFIDFGIVGRISPRVWSGVQSFLASLSSGNYLTMATALANMGATGDHVNVDAFAEDLRSLFQRVEAIDPQLVVTTTTTVGAGSSRGGAQQTVAAGVSVDEEEINKLLFEMVRIGETHGLRFPREFGLLIKQLLYFDRYTRLLAPELSVLQDERVRIGSMQRSMW
eukprot:jgi/Mesvir1/16674/Mv15076-RA.1